MDGQFCRYCVRRVAFEGVLHLFKDLPTVGGWHLGKCIGGCGWAVHCAAGAVCTRAALLGLVSHILTRLSSDRQGDKPAAMLSAHHLTKRFGGLAAVQRRVIAVMAWLHSRGYRPQWRRQINPDPSAVG